MAVLRTVARGLVIGIVTAAVVVAGWFLLLAYPTSLLELLGVLVLLPIATAGVYLAGTLAASLFPDYNVAEVAVEGPISRNGGGGPLGRSPMGAPADDLVEQIETADADSSVDALLLRLNTPGGEIVPSKDIRLAAEAFDGPTVAYATDVCASGGYDVASGCDELWARQGSMVGSIGVIRPHLGLSELADRLGIDYESFTAGEYKDAGVPLKDLDEDDREYLQGLVDDHYDQFVADVAAGRDADPEELRETEARVYLGEEAHELGLVDELGTKDDVEDVLADRLGERVEIREFEPRRSLAGRIRGGAASLAYAFGAGLAATAAREGNFIR